MRRIFSLLLILTLSPALQAAIKTKIIDYKDGKVKLEGFMAYDDAIKGKRPGILVIHEWWGHGEYVRMRAKQLAEMGYVAFAVDMYGKGVRGVTHEEAAKLSAPFRENRKKMRQRAMAGLKILKKQEQTNTDKMAALGYCFGGSTALELARMGADLKGVVSFHGGLATADPSETKNIKAKILVCHGASDPYAKPEILKAFHEEMNNANADWQMIYYGGAVHSFTVKSAGDDSSKGAAYNEKADKRSFQAMKNFFNEIFE